MKIFLIVFGLLSAGVITLALADQHKPLPTQAAEAVQPLAAQFSRTVSNTVNDFLAGTPGPIGDGARHNQQQIAATTAQANRATRKTMAECLKPGALIDLDVKECMDGTRLKDW
ncbi:hypothetical protein SFA35_07240 [Pseudomonas sp. HR96]|uniref:hypothetical protein n=1 Tax=Pseudomonas sp. HR96 TaxID=1027966 RepID=UPI002A76154B|nr:hypothetical protein [Pseudomonas sp. HR96]WPP01144.1 hypothetical protein SFA35_07240 [Pseudomonas sp. HR96]